MSEPAPPAEPPGGPPPSKTAAAGATAAPGTTTSPGATAPGPAEPPGIVNPANALTVLRLIMVPFFVVFLVEGGTGWRLTAFALFVVASVTDLLDGRLARQRGLVTDFGKIADPIADKALTGSALVTLSVLGHLSWWVTVVILIRELGITALRLAVIRRNVIAASRGGKLKTLLQVIAIGLYVLPGPLGLARPVLMGAAVVVTLVTGADYVVRAWSRPAWSRPAWSRSAWPGRRHDRD